MQSAKQLSLMLMILGANRAFALSPTAPSVAPESGFRIDTGPVGSSSGSRASDVIDDSEAVEAPNADAYKQKAAIDCSKTQAAASKSDAEDCEVAKSAYPTCHIVCPTKRDQPQNIIDPPNPDPTPVPNPGPGPSPTPSPKPKPSPKNPTNPDSNDTPGSDTNANNGGKSSSGGNGGSQTSTSESSDLRQCAALKSAAESACNYTDDTDSASDSKSLNSTCDQGASKGLKNSKAKTTAATECSTKFAQCKQTCSEFAETYSESDNFDTFNSNAKACLALSSKADALNDSSSTSYDFAQSSQNCSNNSGESPQSAGGDSNSKATDAQKNAASSAACASDPNSTECVNASQSQGAQAATASGGFGDATASKGSLDVGDTSQTVNSPFGNADGSGGSSAPAKNGTIANNSGGSIPGGGGGAKAGGGGGVLQSAMNAVKSAITDIEKGFLGGGFSGTPTENKPDEMNEASPFGSGEGGRGLASDGGPRKGVDLKRYLPGGDLGPKPQIPQEIRDQFYGPGASLFERIHIRYELKCRLGELFDCQLP